MPTTITDYQGSPLGVYAILYFSISESGHATMQRGCSRDLDLRRAESACEALGPDDLAVVTCESSPGGWRAYGSDAAYWRHVRRRAADRRAARRAAGDLAARKPPPRNVRHADGRSLTLAIADDGFLLASGDPHTEAEAAAAWAVAWPDGVQYAQQIRKALHADRGLL